MLCTEAYGTKTMITCFKFKKFIQHYMGALTIHLQFSTVHNFFTCFHGNLVTVSLKSMSV